jgi:hypothetical protein
MVFKDAENVFAGEAVDRRKWVRLSLVQMNDAPVRSSDPETTLAISKEPRRKERAAGRKRVLLNFPVHELFESAGHAEPELPIVAFDQGLYICPGARRRVQLRRVGLPSP